MIFTNARKLRMLGKNHDREKQQSLERRGRYHDSAFLFRSEDVPTLGLLGEWPELPQTFRLLSRRPVSTLAVADK